jgi:DNA-binding response OmpR family regulator
MVLLVEDEEAIRHLLDDALTEAGFELVMAADGKQALSEIEADAARFRALVTDINLGRGPDGWELARRARELEPEMGVVYMSGGSGHEWAAHGVPKSVLISKPFVPVQIITALSTLLNEQDVH